MKPSFGSQWHAWAMGLALALAGAAVFWPALQCGFVNYDDDVYVTANAHIQAGLTAASVRWAFTTFWAANWHPLTWLSHMFDFNFYGLQPAGHHATSVLFHLASSILLFLVLNDLTGLPGRSAMVAALFSLHPLRVESVVWVAERKDVLSTFFWMLTLWAWIRYAGERKSPNEQGWVFYGAALVFFALGLMAKPMLVTLPFVLLLLDGWPLGRWRWGGPFSWRLVAEKIPFFVVAIASGAATWLAQNSAGAVRSFSRFSFGQRAANIPVSYVRYLGKIFWPENLAVFYPPRRWQTWEVAGAVVALAMVSGWALWQWRARPYLAVGWFWFLGTLVPAIGLVQTGDQALADRYSYVPCVGILIMLVWGLSELAARRPFFSNALMAAGALAIILCAALTRRQISYWQDSVLLFSHTIEATGRNYLASYDLGCALLAQGDYAGAARCFEESLRREGDEISWGNPAPVHNNLGGALLSEGRVAEAVSHFDQALALQPSFPEAYYNLGRAFLTNRQPDVALDCFQHGLAIDPNAADLHYSLGQTLLAQGRVEEGIAQCRRARELALAQGNGHLVSAAEAQLRQYENNLPARAGSGADPR